MSRQFEATSLIDMAEHHVLKAKESLERLIKDQSIPLSERYEFWLYAPTYLKEQGGYMPSWFSNWIDTWADEYMFEKHETVLSSYLVEMMEDEDSDFQYKREGLIPDVSQAINDFKELILKENLHSFEFDW